MALFATAAVFGADAEKSDKAAAPAKTAEAAPAKDAKAEPAKDAKAAPTKDAKAEPAKDAKAAPAAKVEPIACAIPWMIPAGALELKNDAEIDVPAEGIRARADMKVGEKILFKLFDVTSGDPGEWGVLAVNSKVVKVVPAGKDEGGWFRKATVSFEITACHPGRTLMEMALRDRRGAPIRMFRCFIEVK